jgi:hypothetical protein
MDYISGPQILFWGSPHVNNSPLNLYNQLKIRFSNNNYWWALIKPRARGSVVVEALYYKPEGRGIETRRGE